MNLTRYEKKDCPCIQRGENISMVTMHQAADWFDVSLYVFDSQIAIGLFPRPVKCHCGLNEFWSVDQIREWAKKRAEAWPEGHHYRNEALKALSRTPGVERKTYLCLDLGSKTGWAILWDDGSIVSGTESFETSKYVSHGMRLLRFSEWLEKKQSVVRPGAVYFEGVRRHLGTDACHVYGAFAGFLMSWCEKHQIPFLGVDVGKIKKSATGKGNASKEMVIAAMRAKGHDPKDDNQADALALLYYVISL